MTAAVRVVVGGLVIDGGGANTEPAESEIYGAGGRESGAVSVWMIGKDWR